MLVEGDQEQGVGEVRPAGGGGGADRRVDAGQQVLSAQDRGGWVGRQAGEERVHGRVVVVVGMQQVRLDERVGGQPALLGVGEEVVQGGEVGREVLGQPGRMDHPGDRERHAGVDVHPPGQPGGIQPLEDRLGVVVLREAVVGGVDHQPGGAGRVVEGPVGEGLGGHLAEPVVEGREPLGDGRDHRDLLRGVAGHDLGVLVVVGQAAHLAAEGVHIVQDEAVHRRLTARVVRGVERRLHRLKRQEPVVLWCDGPEQLGVGVGVLLARVGVGRVHRGAPRAPGPRHARRLARSSGSGWTAPGRPRPQRRRPRPARTDTPNRLSKDRFSNITDTTWSNR